MYFITTKRMLEVCFSAHPNIQYRTCFGKNPSRLFYFLLFSAGIYEKLRKSCSNPPAVLTNIYIIIIISIIIISLI